MANSYQRSKKTLKVLRRKFHKDAKDIFGWSDLVHNKVILASQNKEEYSLRVRRTYAGLYDDAMLEPLRLAF